MDLTGFVGSAQGVVQDGYRSTSAALLGSHHNYVYMLG